MLVGCTLPSSLETTSASDSYISSTNSISIPTPSNKDGYITKERYITSSIFDYSNLQSAGDIEVNISGTSLNLSYMSNKETSLSFNSNNGIPLYFTNDGINKSPTNLERISLKKGYYILVIDYVEEWYSRNGYFVLHYDDKEDASFNKSGIINPHTKYIENNRLSILYSIEKDMDNLMIALYINPLKNSSTIISRCSFINCGTSNPINITTIVNSYEKLTVNVEKTKVKIFNCTNTNSVLIDEVTLENNENFNFKISPLKNGYLKFIAIDGYLNINYNESKVIYNSTITSFKNDISNNFNTIYHAYGNNVSKMWTANKIERLYEAIDKGYKTLEMDLQFTSDNVPVMIHDKLGEATAQHVYNASTKEYVTTPIDVSDMTYQELLNYDFGLWYGHEGKRILKFEDLLNAAKDTHIKLDIEIKETNMTTEQAQIINDLITSKSMESNITISSFQKIPLFAMFSINNSLTYKVICGNYSSIGFSLFLDRAMSLKSDNNQVIIDASIDYARPLDIALVEELGLKYQAYIASSRTIERLNTLYLSGLSGATSDDINPITYINNPNVVFECFYFDLKTSKYQTTINLYVDELPSLDIILKEIKAINYIDKVYLDVILLSNDKNYSNSSSIDFYPIELSATSTKGETAYATLIINVISK